MLTEQQRSTLFEEVTEGISSLRFQKKKIKTEWMFFLNLFWDLKMYLYYIENNDYSLVMAWWADQGPVSKLCSRTHS